MRLKLSHKIMAVAAICCSPMPNAHGQVTFIENGQERGILQYQMAQGLGGGVAASDFDNDGDIDIFVPNAEGVPDQLYRNLGGGQFEEIAQEAGVASILNNRAAIWFDYDGDHLLDLFVAGDCHNSNVENCIDVMTLRLYRQTDNAQFEDVTSIAGFTDDLIFTTSHHRAGLCAVDINSDGYLDLLTGIWSGEARVFLNNQNGTFTDISISSGIGGVANGHWQPIAHDFNRDGWMDIFWSIDYFENHLWMNQQNLSFIDIAEDAGVNQEWNDMGVTIGDYDNDGDLDIFVTEITINDKHNLLYRNDSSEDVISFSEVSEQAGVQDTSFGWGATFLDCDNDGLLDLAVTNGYISGPWLTDESKFFLNQGGDPVTFADVSAEVGFNDTNRGSSLIAFDIDRDGDLDLLQTCNEGPLRVLENQQGQAAGDNHYLVIKPRMYGPNNRAIGTTVHAVTANHTMMRLISAGTSFMGQEPAEAMFGLGAADSVDSVTINWPDGTQQTLINVAADQVLTVWHNDCAPIGDLDGDGVIGLIDINVLFSQWATDGPADLDGNGIVGTSDLLILLGNWGPCK